MLCQGTAHCIGHHQADVSADVDLAHAVDFLRLSAIFAVDAQPLLWHAEALGITRWVLDALMDFLDAAVADCQNAAGRSAAELAGAMADHLCASCKY